MSWRRWALFIQILGACVLVYAVIQIELGNLTPRTDLFKRTANLVIGAFSIFTIVAATGILKRRAWGYLMEILVILVAVGFFCLQAYFRPDKRSLPGMNYLMMVIYTIGALSEVMHCARRAFQLLHRRPNPSPLSPETSA